MSSQSFHFHWDNPCIQAAGLGQDITWLEFFAGTGNLTRVMASAQYKSVRFDITDNVMPENRRSNFMDLASPSGFALLGWTFFKCPHVIDLKDSSMPTCQQNTCQDHSEWKLRLATSFLLRAVPDDFGCHLGMKCYSFSRMNVGTSARTACSSIGWEQFASVLLGNCLLERIGFWWIGVCFMTWYKIWGKLTI